MVFCTNCGNPMSTSVQAEIPTAPKVQLTDPIQRPMATAAPAKSNTKLWIGGLLGCLGLLFLGGVGAVALIAISSATAGNYTNSNRTGISSPGYPTPYPTFYPTPDVTNTPTANPGSELLDIFDEKKEVGRFRQVNSQIVPVESYFPFAQSAALASYHNGSKYVTIAIGKFDTFENAKKNFDDQFTNTKRNGGKTQILPVGKDGTINGVYQIKKSYYAEYCTTSAFCYRLVSTDAKALETFIKGFVTL